MTASPERTLIVLRHGRTAWNASGRFQGQADPPLDAVGRRQARAAAARLARMRPWGVITSDLRRARQTAAAVGAACNTPVREDPALREVDLGAWEGLDEKAAARLFPVEHASWRRGEDVRRGGGETLAEAGARVAVAIMAAVAECPPGDVLVVVSHGLVLRHTCRVPHLANGAWAALAFPAAAYTLRSSTPDALAVGR